MPDSSEARRYQGGSGGFLPDANDQPGQDLMSTLIALLHGAGAGPMASTEPSDPRVAAIQRYMEMQGAGPVPLQESRPQMMGNFSGRRGAPIYPRDMTPFELEGMISDMNRGR